MIKEGLQFKFCFFSFFLLLLQGAGPDSKLPAMCGPAVDRYGQRSHSQAEANTWSNNGCLHLHGTGVGVWMKDNRRNALKNCTLTSQSGLLFLIASNEEAVLSWRPFRFSWTFVIDRFDVITEIQHEGSADSQPAGGAASQPHSGSSSKWSRGPNVDGGQAQAAAALHHQALPVLPQHQELQLLHLPDYVRPSPRSLRGCLQWPLTSMSPLAGCRSWATIFLRWIQSDRSGSTRSSCTPFCPETE